MTWLIVAIIAYFLYAVSSLIDKYILSESVPKPVVYSFYVGVLGIFALVFAPFGLIWPGFTHFFISLFVGGLYLFALLAFFSSLKKGEASRIMPIVGGFAPIFVFLLSYFFLEERFGQAKIIAFLLLVSGGVLISFERNRKLGPEKLRFSLKGFISAIFAAFLFAIFYTSLKFVYLNQPFLSGFIWTRIGSFFAAFLLLIPFKNRRAIFDNAAVLKIKTGALIVFNKAIAGFASILLNLAVFLGSVTLINALSGIQYVFVLALVILISKTFPRALEEKTNAAIILQKIFSVSLIGTGLIILGLAN